MYRPSATSLMSEVGRQSTLAEMASFRVFQVGGAGAIMGTITAGILPVFLALRDKQEEAAASEKHTE